MEKDNISWGIVEDTDRFHICYIIIGGQCHRTRIHANSTGHSNLLLFYILIRTNTLSIIVGLSHQIRGCLFAATTPL